MILLIEKFLSLVLLWNSIRLILDNVQYPIWALLSVEWLLTGGKKNKENFKFFALKVVAVTYERWLLTRGSK